MLPRHTHAETDLGREHAPSRWVGLDLLRGLAILLVLGHHQPTWAWPPVAWEQSRVMHLWWRFGWVGVDLFFVLSGFLVGGILLREIKQTGVLDARRFYLRRAWKIWPPYFTYLAAVALLWTWDGWPSPAQLWPNLLHIQSYTDIWPYPITHTWSLAVEEHFYLLLPLLLLVLSPHRLPYLFPPVAVCALAARLAAALVHPDWRVSLHYTPTHARLDSLLAGVLLAYLVHHAPGFVPAARRWRGWLPVAGLLCLAPALFVERDTSVLFWSAGFSLLWLGSACLVLWAWLCEDILSSSLPARRLAALGTASYGIYLWHMPFGHRAALLLARQLGVLQNREAVFVLYLVLAVTAGWLMTLAIEKPMLALRDRWMRRGALQRQARSRREELRLASPCADFSPFASSVMKLDCALTEEEQQACPRTVGREKPVRTPL